ncbi:thioesterase family protein [Bacillus infantis]|uniref:Thioesterase n=1 Tax=Bacillus infantis TaxID=324767 RepID=A0A5D4RDC4_9BACI|nr:thioesterase [Bacillus infantis]TYS47994.1 thioesterase [Bacillus infantis]
MKPGLKEGAAATIQLKVGREMFAQFGGEIVHPLFSTASMVYYMEWASRKVILPFLEESEEGMGYAVTVKHLAPAAEESILDITAEVVRLEWNLVFTSVKALHGDTVIGKGEVTQAILPRSRINRFTEKIRLD